MADSESMFKDADERLAAMQAYYGLCSWMDHNVGRILEALDQAGFGDDTTVIYTSDHGDNVGARGLWGKSVLYEESTAIPMIMAGPGVPHGTCDTGVTLLDISATIPDHFGLDFDCAGASLHNIASRPEDPERPVLSQYHAVGAVSGAYMLRVGRWKLHHYLGFEPELFDLETDPEELTNLASDPAHANTLARMQCLLRDQLDPDAVDAMAFADQAALIASHGGREKAMTLGASAATPPPEIAP